MDRPTVAVIVPAYNEETRIIPTLERIADFLGRQNYSWELLVVDDGSTDATPQLVETWADSHHAVRLLRVPHRGKGWAVKSGMLEARGEYRLMCDADLAVPIETLPQFLEKMTEGYDIVIGSREATGARRFHEPLHRHLMGRLFNWSVKLIALRGFQDTQCGFKCFRGEVADELFAMQRIDGWGFDVEILYLAFKRHLKVLELPVDWYYQEGSKIRRGADSFSMLRDAATVRWRSLTGKYRQVRQSSSKILHEGESVQYDHDAHERRSESQEDTSLAVIVPTYNEAANLTELARRIFSLGIPNTRLIVVDDASPDGTAELAVELGKKHDGRVEVIRRKGKLGLGTAYIEGFARALVTETDYVVQMDADLSHAPEYLPAFLKKLEDADVVVGSRYVRGGGTDPGWSFKRRTLSYVANLGIRLVAGLKVNDATSGFKAYRSSALRSLDFSQFRCHGFGFQAEVAHACQQRGHVVVEHPITFVDRAEGRSKMSLRIAIEAFLHVLPLRWRRYGT